MELLGNCGLLSPIVIPSLNYEHVIVDRKASNSLVTVRVGLNTYAHSWIPVIPVLINSISNKRGRHHLETGIGFYGIPYVMHYGGGYHPDIEDYGIAGCLMYRYQKPGKGFIFRFGYTPLFTLDRFQDPIVKYFNWFMIGISAGYSFGK